MQSELLDKNPGADLAVYAVWFKNLRSDARGSWPSDALRDPRVVHFWDAQEILGRWYAKSVTKRGTDVEWDAYFLYEPHVHWGDTAPANVSWGRTIMETREQLRGHVRALLDYTSKK